MISKVRNNRLLRRVIFHSSTLLKDKDKFYSMKKEYLSTLWRKHINQEIKYYLFVTVLISLVLFVVFTNEVILNIIAIMDLIIVLSLIRMMSHREIEKIVRKEFDKKYGLGKYDELKIEEKN
ncbi:MAG: hypothetical protein ACP5N1_06555 [Candidatus Woesearchaeota archaeon]